MRSQDQAWSSNSQRAPEPSPWRLMQWDHIGRESRAAHARLGLVLDEITDSFDLDICGGRVHALSIPQRPRQNIADTFAV